MRDTIQKKFAILVTDDPEVEATAQAVAESQGDILQLLHSKGDATCTAFDAFASETFAILDVDAPFGTRSMFNTIAGLLPVIAISRQETPWLKSLLRHHRIGASVIKPVHPEALQQAFRTIEEFHGRHSPSSR